MLYRNSFVNNTEFLLGEWFFVHNDLSLRIYLFDAPRLIFLAAPPKTVIIFVLTQTCFNSIIRLHTAGHFFCPPPPHRRNVPAKISRSEYQYRFVLFVLLLYVNNECF